MRRILFVSLFSLLCITSYARDVMEITESKVFQASYATGIGNADAPVLYIMLNVDGTGKALTLHGIRLNLNGTSALSDITRLKVFSSSTPVNLHHQKANPKELASCRVSGKYSLNQDFDLKFSKPALLHRGPNYLWLAADVSRKATEGHDLDARITGYFVAEESGADPILKPEPNGNPLHATKIFLSESHLAYSWTDDSHFWRIPAITTGKKGRLIAVMDKRWDSNYDLPNKIDVVSCYSDDRGRTWSPRQTIAGTPSLGGDYGHGDPGIVYNRRNGDILVIVVSRKGFFDSAPDDNARIKLIVSHDNGQTWDAPRDITDQLYGAGCTDPVRSQWHGAFAASGAMMQTRSGRLMTVLCVCETEKNYITNYVIYSDDDGLSWQVCPDVVARGGDESKVVELSDGRIMVSVRHRGARIFNIGTPDAEGNLHFGEQRQWEELLEPACNGDFIRYSLQSEGAVHDRLLHTICRDAANRRNVSCFLSYDEGASWTSAVKTLCPGGSAYSALTVLNDGTIGCFLEEEPERDYGYDGYSLQFIRFSLPWLTDSKDREKKSLFKRR